MSERLAHALMQEIEGTADFLINLHTMNALFDQEAKLFTPAQIG